MLHLGPPAIPPLYPVERAARSHIHHAPEETVILSVPSLEQTRAREGTGRWACPFEIHRHNANPAVSGYDYGSRDVFVDEGLILLDVHATVQDYDGGFDGSLRGVAFWTTLHPGTVAARQYSQQGSWTRATAILRLSASTSSSDVASLLRCIGLNKPQDTWPVFFFGQSLGQFCAGVWSGRRRLTVCHLGPSYLVPFMPNTAPG
ncbi:hypothetical protein EVAR_84195_1 [Eumeta japonica]|uniref:Uncharacterized protein n=1 Tax=Eumeta variegata TaxID=151549 RepID=A0A4C1S8P6_EUMVA|nr:hypothetical protein EVAR_84195_1 [Eumeta japonica]